MGFELFFFFFWGGGKAWEEVPSRCLMRLLKSKKKKFL